MANTERGALVPLSRRRDLRIAAGNPDVRRWAVFGCDGLCAGWVHDLIVDTGCMKVVFLDVVVAATLSGRAGVHILIPAHEVRLAGTHAGLFAPGGQVVVDSMTSAELVGRHRAPRILLGPGIRIAGARAGWSSAEGRTSGAAE
jgi:hypothetical protein